MDTGCTDCKIVIKIIKSGSFKDYYSTADIFTTGNVVPDIAVATPQSVQLTTTNNHAGAVNVGVSANFNIPADLKAKSTIEMQFPSNYPNFQTSEPKPVCTTSISGATCEVKDKKVVVSGITSVPRGTTINISVTGLKNPSSAGDFPAAPSGYNIEAKTEAGKQIAYSGITTDWTVKSADPIPSTKFEIKMQYPNYGLLSDYDTTISFDTVIFVDSSIEFNFPGGYNLARDKPTCSLIGDIQEFTSCTIESNKVTLKLKNELKANYSIVLRLTNILNPTSSTPKNTVGDFTINAIYDKETICETKGTNTGRTITMYD
jgi:hypothetical protein